MAAPISIGIAADANDFARGIKSGVIKPLEDVKEVYDDIKDASDDAARGEKLERTLKDQQGETKQLAGDYEKLAAEIKGVGKAGKSSIGDDLTDGTDRAKEGVEGLKDEAQSTGREMAASFQGPEDALGAIQELAANALSGLGPAGVAAGIAGAIGIGVITSEITKQQEKAEEVKDALVDAYLSAAEEGRNYITQEEVNSKIRAQLNEEDTAAKDTRLSQATKLGLTTATLLRAEAGDLEALKSVEDALAEAREKHEDSRSAYNKASGIDNSRSAMELTDIGNKYGGIREATNLARDAVSEYQSAVEEGAASTSKISEGQRDATAATRGTRDAVNEVAGALRGIQDKTVQIGVRTNLEQARRDLDNFIVSSEQRGIRLRVAGVNSAGGVVI